MSLKKNIGFFGVFSIATGAMISSGIFILPSLAYSQIGAAAFISYFIAGVLGAIGIFSVIELSTAMPKAGGDYYFVNRSLGPMMGTISGFLGWFALSLKSAFAIFGLSEIIFLLTGIPLHITAGILCIFFVGLNIVGVKEAVVFQIAMVGFLVIFMILYVILGTPQIELSKFNNIGKTNINSIIITAGFIFISFGGLLNVANISEEVHNPKRNIPLGMISSIVFVTILYTATVFVTTGILDGISFSNSLTPIADTARIIAGQPGFVIISIASTLAFVTTANAGIMSASRYPLALSRDKLLPSFIDKVNKKFQTPTLAIVFTGIIIYLSLLLPIELLVKSASTIILTSYVLTNIAVLILRESGISNYKPSFKTPLYPWIQIFGIFVFSFFIVDMGKSTVEISIIFLLICFIIYLFYGKKRNTGTFALLHLMKRITDKKLTETLLEDELREIIINRDELEQDDFDSLIKNGKFFEIDIKTDFNHMIDRYAEDISKEIKLDVHTIKDLYNKRQKDSNTAISEFVAIPHIVTPEVNKMFFFIIRAKKGIKFTNKEKKVKAIFLFGGPQNKRDIHLKILASLATIVSDKNFETKWLNAQNETEIKDLFLFSKRKRL